MKELSIGKNDEGQRLDRFVSKSVPLLPASLLQKYIRLKRIKINGKRAERDTRLHLGDTVQLYINDEFFDRPRADNAYLTVTSPRLHIVYEDENILLVDKQPGLAVHPHDGAEYGKTLIDHIQAYLYAKGAWRPRESTFVPALCNRIDRNTGGIVIAAKNAGLTVFQAFLASLLCNASAGEYAGFTLIAAQAPYWELALVTLIANARYLLMSCALAQRFAPGTPFFHRLIIGYDVTDELFGITIARPGYLNPFYTYGAIALAAPAWASGTALGIIAGNLLPLRAVSALSVALYGMFLAIIIPPARKDKIVAALVAISFALSFACTYLPGISALSDGTRTIILTVAISCAGALLFPVKTQSEEAEQ